MKTFLNLCIFAFSFITQAQTVEISGNALFFAQEKIEVHQYTGAFAKQTKIIGQTRISPNGEYTLTLTLDTPKILTFKIEMREISIPIHPNTKISLDFIPIKNSGNQRNPLQVSLRYLSYPPHTAIPLDYNNIEIDFLNFQFDLPIHEDNDTLYTLFFDTIALKFDSLLENDHLFNTYFTYLKANAFLKTKINKHILFDTYIVNKPIKYDQPEYIKLFTSISQSRVQRQLYEQSARLDSIFETDNAYLSIMNILSGDSLLALPEIRSLALLTYCMFSTNNTILHARQKYILIKQISNQCPYPKQKWSAQKHIQNHRQFDIGKQAIDFTLTDQDGNEKSLSSFSEKITYLGFINSKSITCMKDLQIINNLKSKFRRISFVFIICDRDSIAMENLPPRFAYTHLLIYKQRLYPIRSLSHLEFPCILSNRYKWNFFTISRKKTRKYYS